jgi:hypothetical protein
LRTLILAAAITCALLGRPAMAQTPTKDSLVAETEILEAQRARDVKAAEALAAAAALALVRQDADPAVAARKKRLADEKALVEAEKEVLALRKANSEAAAAESVADKAALQAQLGGVPDAPTSKGSITVATGGGKGEAVLLAALATRKAAAKIASSVGVDQNVLLVAGKAKPLFDDWDQFEIGSKLLGEQFARAQTMLDNADSDHGSAGSNVKGTGVVREFAVPLAVGTAVESLAKLGQFFQSEYSVANIDLTPDNDLLVAATAQAFRSPLAKNKKSVRLIDFNPLARPAATILPLLKVLADLADTAVAGANTADRQAALLKGKLEAAKADEKPSLQNAVAAYEGAAAAARAAVTAYDQFAAQVLTSEAGQRPRIARIAEAHEVVEALKGDTCVVFLNMNSIVGGMYTKSNLWTFLGEIPFRTMGGVVISFTALQGKTGAVIASGVVPVHGGYRTVRGVENAVNDSVF